MQIYIVLKPNWLKIKQREFLKSHNSEELLLFSYSVIVFPLYKQVSQASEI